LDKLRLDLVKLEDQLTIHPTPRPQLIHRPSGGAFQNGTHILIKFAETCVSVSELSHNRTAIQDLHSAQNGVIEQE